MFYDTKKTTSTSSGQRLDHLVAHESKLQPAWIAGNAERIIEQLVRTHDLPLERSLRYYNGERDPMKFAALTDNYGIGAPTMLPFISLMKRHIKALMGYFMELPFPVTVAATDRDSIWQAREEGAQALVESLAQHLNTAAGQAWMGLAGSGQQEPVLSQQAFQDLRRQNETFTSKLERFCSILLDSLVDRLGLRLKMVDFVESMSTAGRLAYRCWLEEADQVPRFEPIPLGELHYVRDQSLGDLRNHKQIVRKRRMLRSDVLNRWGHLMNVKERNVVGGKNQQDLGDFSWVPLVAGGAVGAPTGKDERGENSGVQTTGNYLDVIAMRRHGLKEDDVTSMVDVYEVEFCSPSDDQDEDTLELPYNLTGQLSTLEVHPSVRNQGARQKMYRYSCIRIGSNLYLSLGRDKFVQRPPEDPYACWLSYNGTHEQTSLLLETEDLQDKSDILNWHQDNLIAMGGVPGVMFDINDIPRFLGTNNATRVLAWRAYLKQGLALVDRNQTGRPRGQQPDPGQAFNNSGKIDTSFNGQSISAIREQLSYIEEQASRISGVPRQMLSEISERDGKATTQMALSSATKVNRPLFSTVMRFCQAAMTDMVNLCRITAQHNPELISAMIGSVAARLIGAGAERFPLAQLNVYLKDAIEEKDTLDRLRQAGAQLVEAMAVDPRLMIDIASVNNVAKLRDILYSGVEQFKDDKLKQLEEQNKQLQQQVDKSEQGNQQFEQAQLQLQDKEINGNLQLGQQKNELQAQKDAAEARHDAGMLELEEERVNLEGKQLLYNQQAAEVADK